MNRIIRVIREGQDPGFPVEISLLGGVGGQVTELRLTESEMVDLAKCLDLLCSDKGLISVQRKPQSERY